MNKYIVWYSVGDYVINGALDDHELPSTDCATNQAVA